MPTTAAEPLSLAAIDVAVTYPNGHTALRGASFRLAGGTICALVGVNGSGKSTLFKALMGFVTPTTGRVEINGRPVREAQKQSWVAYVPQAEEVDWTFPVSVHDVEPDPLNPSARVPVVQTSEVRQFSYNPPEVLLSNPRPVYITSPDASPRLSLTGKNFGTPPPPTAPARGTEGEAGNRCHGVA